MSDSYTEDLTPLAKLLYEGIEAQTDRGDIDTTTETAIAIAPPIDLEELATFIRTASGHPNPETGDPIETNAEAAAAHAAQNLTITKVFVSEGHEFTRPQAFFEFSDESVAMLTLDQFRAVDKEIASRFTLAKSVGLEGEMLSTWPDFEDGRKVRVFVTGPNQPTVPSENMTYIRQALVDLITELDKEQPIREPDRYEQTGE